MFKYAVIKCKDCHLEMDLVPFMCDLVPFGIGLHCRNCHRYFDVECHSFSVDLSDFFSELPEELPF